MYPDKYNTAIENDCINQEKAIQRLSEKRILDPVLAESSRRTTRETIKHYLTENKEYGRLLRSLSYITNPPVRY